VIRREPAELVIFDCDGVLVDTERIAVRLNVEIGPKFGWPITAAEVVELFIGRSATSINATIAERIGSDAANLWDEAFLERHHTAVEAELQPVTGIREALDQIALPVCVASSGSHEKMQHTLGLTGLYEHFEGRIFSATEVQRGKPAPDLFLHAADRMGVAPPMCVVVEDSSYGVEAARAAGMRALAYAGGITPPDRLRGPDTVVFHDMRKLPALLAEL